MTHDQREFTIAIYRGEPDAGRKLEEGTAANNLEVGLLLDTLVTEPDYFPDDETQREQNSIIEIKVQRTHEWELIIWLLMKGGAVFLGAVAGSLAKRLVDWSIARAEKLLTGRNPEMRAEGLAPVVIDPSARDATIAAVKELLTNAAGKEVRIIIEPGR